MQIKLKRKEEVFTFLEAADLPRPDGRIRHRIPSSGLYIDDHEIPYLGLWVEAQRRPLEEGTKYPYVSYTEDGVKCEWPPEWVEEVVE